MHFNAFFCSDFKLAKLEYLTSQYDKKTLPEQGLIFKAKLSCCGKRGGKLRYLRHSQDCYYGDLDHWQVLKA